MGEAAKAAGDGGAAPGDGGAGDARALCRRGGEARPAAQHTAARRRVRTGRASTVTSPLSASRADEEQLPASTEQVRERRAGVGGRGWGRGRVRRAGAGAARGGQEGGAAAEGDAVVGAHGRAADAAVPGRGGSGPAALRDGAAPRRAAARRVTRPRTLPYHAYIPLSGRSASPDYCTLGIYLLRGRLSPPRPRAEPRRVNRSLRLKYNKKI